MSLSEWDEWNDGGMESMFERLIESPQAKDRFYEAFYDDIVKDFTVQRMHEYFLETPDVIGPAEKTLKRARLLREHDATAAFTFGAIATEVGFKVGLIKPVLSGVFDTSKTASMIVAWAIKQQSSDLIGILVDILKVKGNIDLEAHKRPGINQNLWEEMKAIKTVRNNAVHAGQTVTMQEADKSIGVATELIEVLFPQLVDNLGLYIKGGRIFAKL